MDRKWVFMRTQNNFGYAPFYKTLLVVQSFTQHLVGIDYEKMFSHVMDSITFKHLLSLAVDNKLGTRLMNVVAVYLYGSIDIDIYMKVPIGLVEFHHF